MIDIASLFLDKADESLAGAEAEFASGRYNNTANRCYYACFQAAIFALDRAGIRPLGGQAQWSHVFVPAQFAGQLIQRRKLSPASLRDVLSRTYLLRQTADYRTDLVTQTDASRALRRARDFLSVIQATGGEGP